MHVLDLQTATDRILTYGPAAEANPFARALVEQVGLQGLAFVKLAVVILGLLVLVRLRRYASFRLVAGSLFTVVLIGFVGMVSNVA